jgi:uncharacterized membrane protein HdeD (DUF308 family)
MSSKSYDVVWGTISVLLPEITCMGDLWKYNKKWKYFISSFLSYLRYLCVVAYSGAQHIVCCVFALFRRMYPVLPVYLDCDLWKYNKKWKYFINLTGQEFPLRTNYELVKILKIYNGSNDIEGTVKR